MSSLSATVKPKSKSKLMFAVETVAAVAALTLAGCSTTTTSEPQQSIQASARSSEASEAESTTISAPPSPALSLGGDRTSLILPAIALPRGSKYLKGDTLSDGMKVEAWRVPLSFKETRDYIEPLLPIGETFDDATYRGAESGMETNGERNIKWTWATDEPGTFIAVDVRQMNETSMVGIAYLRDY